jgi:hypothetical protein
MTNLSLFAGHNVVPKPEGENETGPGGTEEGRGECEDSYVQQEFPGKRQRHEHPQEEIRHRSGR